MKYEKAKAEVVLFDNSDVLTAPSGDKNPNQGSGNNCGGGCGAGNTGNGHGNGRNF